MKKMLLLCSSVTLLSSSVMAEEFAYLGASYSDATLEGNHFGAVIGRIGYQFNDYAAIEGRFGVGVQDKNVNYDGISIDVGYNTLFSGYLKPILANNTDWKPYALLGFTAVELEARGEVEGVTAAVRESETGFSYGLGVDWNFTDRAAMNIEYMQVVNDNSLNIKAWNFGLTYKIF